MRQIWNDSKGKHSKADSLLNENDNIKAAQKSLKIDQIQKAKSHFFALESQGLSARTVTKNIPKKRILFWSTYIESLPGFLYNFVRKSVHPTTAYFSQPCYMEKNSQSFLQSLPFIETRNEQTYFIELRFTSNVGKIQSPPQRNS